LVVDTLIAETNAGSVRWMYGLAEMPLSPLKVQEGDLSEYLLPLRGFSVEELKQKQEEKQALRAKREKGELERLRKEEHEQLVRRAAERMTPYQFDDVKVAQFAGPNLSPMTSLDERDDWVDIPGVNKKSSLAIAQIVNSVAFSQNSNATSLQIALVPKGTAPALLFEKATSSINALLDVIDGGAPIQATMATNESINAAGREDALQVNLDDSLVVSLNGDDDGDGALIEQNDTFHKEAIIEPDVNNATISVPISDIAIGQLESDSLPEILDYSPVDSILSDYERQVIETLEAEKAELLETQAILNAPPAAEGIEELEKQEDVAPKSINATSVEPWVPVEQVFEVIQLVQESNTSVVESISSDPALLDETGIDFIPQLLDEQLTVEDYEKQFQVIIQAAHEERLETQAILNAPPAAEVIEVLEKDQGSLLNALNITEKTEDELAVLEMDEPEASSTATGGASNTTAAELVLDKFEFNADVGSELATSLDSNTTNVDSVVREVNGIKP
jgi:hypothetical protein